MGFFKGFLSRNCSGQNKSLLSLLCFPDIGPLALQEHSSTSQGHTHKYAAPLPVHRHAQYAKYGHNGEGFLSYVKEQVGAIKDCAARYKGGGQFAALLLLPPPFRMCVFAAPWLAELQAACLALA